MQVSGQFDCVIPCCWSQHSATHIKFTGKILVQISVVIQSVVKSTNTLPQLLSSFQIRTRRSTPRLRRADPGGANIIRRCQIPCTRRCFLVCVPLSWQTTIRGDGRLTWCVPFFVCGRVVRAETLSCKQTS